MPLSAYERAAASWRADLLQRDNAALYDLRKAYEQAQTTLTADYKKAVQSLEDQGLVAGPVIGPDGTWTGAGAAGFRAYRLGDLVQQVDQELRGLNQLTADTAAGQIDQGHAVGAAHAADMLDAATPDVGINFTRLPREAFAAGVGMVRSGTPLGDLLDQRAGKAAGKARSLLTDAIAVGRNPNDVGRELAKLMEAERWRGQLIARNALLDASREAAFATYDASDAVIGWRWLAARSTRTCLACLALHNREFPKSERFMQRHPACRCCPAPIVDPALGGDAPLTESGEDWLRKQSDDVQRGMIPASLRDDWKAGNLQLTDFLAPRDSPVWGRSWGQGTVDQVMTNATPMGRSLRNLPGGEPGSIRTAPGSSEAPPTTPTPPTAPPNPMATPAPVPAGPPPFVYTPATTVADALAYAQQLGVTAEYGKRLDIANMMNEGLGRASHAGFQLPAHIFPASTRSAVARDGNRYQMSRRSPGAYAERTDTFVYNPNNAYWKDPAAVTSTQHRMGFWSTDDPLAVVYHEIGHAAHAKDAGSTLFRRLANSPISPGVSRAGYEEQERLAKEVSRYAVTDRAEFVAEVFAGRMAGKTYSADVMDRYRDWGGPE